jgi:AI-2 transport protein TqsA
MNIVRHADKADHRMSKEMRLARDHLAMTQPPAKGSVEATAPSPPVLPRGIIVLLGTAALFIAVFGMRQLSSLIGPLFLGLMLVIVAWPVQTWLQRRGVPRLFASLALLLVVYGILFVLVATLAVSVARLATILPNYADQAQDLIDSLNKRLEEAGAGSDAIKKITSQIDLSQVLNVVDNLLGAVSGVLSSLSFLVVLLFFMGLEAGGFPRRLGLISDERRDVAYAMTTFAIGVRRYLVVSTIFGLIVAVIDTIVLYALDVPLPVLWGLLAFITNYVPNIGFVIGLIPPALLALLDGGVDQMILVIAFYCVVNFVIQSIIQPKFVGDSVGLSTTVTFLALVFWAFILGPLGALLAVPLTLLAKALLVDIDPDTRWLNHLLGSTPAEKEAA